jgi:hypothetical protein
MKIRLHHILILIFVASLGVVSSAHAQEFGLPEMDITEPENGGVDREKIMTSPGEADNRYSSKSSTTTNTPTDSAATTSAAPVPTPKIKAEKQPPAIKPAVEKQSKEEDDSILSFNFLYYLIQKYKLQDIR